MQEIGPCRVAEIGVAHAKLAQNVELFGAKVDHRRRIASGAKHAVDNPAHATAPCNDNPVLFFDRIGVLLLAACIQSRHDLIVQDEQQWRDQHGQRHDQQE